MGEFERSDSLLKDEEIQRIRKARVAVFGLGGVGGYALEALARMGIGHLFLCDGDRIEISNINRQLLALHSTIGRPKTEVAAERIRDINPKAEIKTIDSYFNEDTLSLFSFDFDYVVDCIDSVKDKALLIKEAKARNIPIISSMGTGNRLNAVFTVSDIKDVEADPLAKSLRKSLASLGISSVKTVSAIPSSAQKRKPASSAESPVGSISYVAGMAGLKIAEEVVRDIISPVI